MDGRVSQRLHSLRMRPGAESNAGEQGRSQGGNRRRGGRVQRLLQDVRQQLSPARIERSAAGESQLVCLDASSEQGLEALANGKGHALEGGAKHVTTPVLELKANPGSARVRIEVRRPFSGEIRKKDQAIRTGRSRKGLAVEVAPFHAEGRAHPLQRKPGVLQGCHAVPTVGRRGAVDVSSSRGIDGQAVAGSHDLGAGSNRELYRAGVE